MLIVSQTYGPQAPTAYGNGPSIVEPQAEWIIKVMKKMQKQGKTRINAKESYEREWKKEVNDLHAATLRHNVDSWYMGKFTNCTDSTERSQITGS